MSKLSKSPMTLRFCPFEFKSCCFIPVWLDTEEWGRKYTSDMLVIFIILTLSSTRRIPYLISCFVYTVTEETEWCDVVNKISARQSFCWKRYHMKIVYISIEKSVCVAISNFILRFHSRNHRLCSREFIPRA
jgi:hypothetical protein